MSRQEVYREIEEAFGLVPTFFKVVADSIPTSCNVGNREKGLKSSSYPKEQFSIT